MIDLSRASPHVHVIIIILENGFHVRRERCLGLLISAQKDLERYKRPVYFAVIDCSGFARKRRLFLVSVSRNTS